MKSPKMDRHNVDCRSLDRKRLQPSNQRVRFAPNNHQTDCRTLPSNKLPNHHGYSDYDLPSAVGSRPTFGSGSETKKKFARGLVASLKNLTITNIPYSPPNIFLKALAPTIGRCATVSTRFVAKKVINQ